MSENNLLPESPAEVVIPEELIDSARLAALIAAVEAIGSDPLVLEAAEAFHRDISRLTLEDLLRRFDFCLGC